jgi:hypothetical protein
MSGLAVQNFMGFEVEDLGTGNFHYLDTVHDGTDPGFGSVW